MSKDEAIELRNLARGDDDDVEGVLLDDDKADTDTDSDIDDDHDKEDTRTEPIRLRRVPRPATARSTTTHLLDETAAQPLLLEQRQDGANTRRRITSKRVHY